MSKRKYQEPALVKKSSSFGYNQHSQFEDEDNKTASNRMFYMIDRLEKLGEEYNRLCISSGDPTFQAINDNFLFFVKYHDIHYQFEEHWKFAGLTKAGKLNPKLIEKIVMTREEEIDGVQTRVWSKLREKEIEFYFENQISSFYGNLYSKWNVRIHPSVFESLLEIDKKSVNDLFLDYLINNIIWGHFEIEDESYTMFGCSTFYIPLGREFKLFASTNLERTPLIDNKGENFIGQDFKHYLKIISFHHNKDFNDLSCISKDIGKAHIMIQNDRNKHEIFEEPFVRKIFNVSSYPIVLRAYKQEWVYYGQTEISESPASEEKMKLVYCPMDIKLKGKLIESAYQMFEYKDNTWIFDNEEKYYTSGVVMDQMAQKVISEEGNQMMILNFFERLEKFGIKFEESQKRMLLSSRNTIALGRSGTGKTTVSAFKVLAIEILFKAYSKSKLTGSSNIQLEVKDLSIYASCGVIFCTASPVLTNEVRRYYLDLLQKIKEYLVKREKARLFKKQQQTEDKKKEEDTQKEQEDDFELDSDDDELKEAKAMKESIKVALEATKMDMEDQLEEEAIKHIPASTRKLTSEHFPCFLTIKKLIYMMDASLSYPFFSRSSDGKIYGMDKSTEWHNESKQGAFMINQYHKDNYDFSKKIKELGKRIIQVDEIDDDEKIKRLKEEGIDAEKSEVEANDKTVKDLESDSESDEDEDYDNADIYKNYQYLNSQKSYKKSYHQIIDQTFAQEVDFEMFESKFYNKNKGRLKLSAMNVWTEIFSVIKGGLQTDWRSYTRWGSNSVMTKARYMKIKSSMDYLSTYERIKIYWLYVKYEQWKSNHNMYDFMDVVRHVYYNFPIYTKTKIDYLVVDEVQDLTPLTIQLLVSATNNNVFFCGDTAQTIAKGVGFRFYDLKDIFCNQQVSIPTVIQLTKNYRSHNKILDLANSIVDVIEFFFPQTIDKLQREKSDLDGPMPILLENFKEEDLMAMIIGHSETRSPQFGCNQVVIVRDQETKTKLPFFLKQALCLTVYESKGLEFDDVILYNFFNNSNIENQWRLLKEIEVHHAVRRKIRLDDDDMTLNELDYHEFNKKLRRLEEAAKVDEDEKVDESELEEYVYLEATRQRDEVLRNFSLLCNDLKHLYVSITRPKQRLLIYDDNQENLGAIKSYWVQRGVVDVVKKGDEHAHPVLKGGFETLADEASSKQEWLSMGIKLFRKKFYLSAATCFEKSEDLDLRDKCNGYYHADKATTLLNDAEALFFMAHNNKNLKRIEKQQKKNEGKEIKKQSFVEFKQAGEIFKKLGSTRQAAQCYYTAECYNEAAVLFVECEMFSQAAECFMITKQYEKAAKMFEEKIERQSLTNKYVPLALNSIFNMMQEGNNEENRGKVLAEKYMKQVQQIQEESDYESENEQDDNNQENQKENEDVDKKQDNAAANQKQETEAQNEGDKESKAVIEEAKQPQVEIIENKYQEEIIDTSFEVISKDDIVNNFEHLSNFDPEDEFLSSNKSFSLIGSVVSKDQESLSEYSDFSIVSGSRVGSIMGANTIQTNRDIYIEDVAMQKIIYYISLFSEETRGYLQKLRSKNQLNQAKTTELKVDTFELELDNIDIDLVKILLDVLESYDMFRL